MVAMPSSLSVRSTVLFWPEQKRLVEEKTDEIVAQIRDYDRQLKE